MQKAETAMKKIESFRDLDAWNVAMDMAVRLYALLRCLPQEEKYELAGQMRQAAVSVPSNVAEGHSVGMPARYRYHVRIALGSVGELSTCVELCRRLNYIDLKTAERAEDDLSRTRQLLHGILRSLRVQLAVKSGALILAALWWLNS